MADAPAVAGGLPERVGLADFARFAQAVAGALPAAVGATCARGCVACCHQRVLVSPAEAALLAPELRGAGMRARLRELAGRTGGGIDGHRGWLAARLACPLLDTAGACMVYARRPLVCREHLALSDPRWCWDPDGSGIALIQSDPRVSDALAAACTRLRDGVDERIPIDAIPVWSRLHARLLRRRWRRDVLLQAFCEAVAAGA